MEGGGEAGNKAAGTTLTARLGQPKRPSAVRHGRDHSSMDQRPSEECCLPPIPLEH